MDDLGTEGRSPSGRHVDAMNDASTDIVVVPRGPAGHFLPAALGWVGRRITLTDRPGGGRYVILLPVLDFARLGFPDADGRLGLLEPQDVADLSAGRAALLLDLSNEGPGFQAHVFDALHGNLERRGIPRAQVILVCQNRMLRHDYERACGEGLRFWTFEFFPLQVALWLDEAAGPRLFPDHPLERGGYAPFARAAGEPRFLCQNAALRWHRVLLYRWFQLNGMDRHGLISFHGIGPDNPKAAGIDVFHAPPGIAAAFGPLLADVGRWIPRRAQRLDAPARGNDLVLTLDASAYAGADLTVISETDFFEAGVERITEKALKAAAMGLPFVMAGAPRSVARLSELGFATFEGLIDQHYDAIADPAARLRAVFRSIEGAWGLCRGDNAAWRRRARDQGLANVAHARGGLLQQLDRVMVAPFVGRMVRFMESGAVAP